MIKQSRLLIVDPDKAIVASMTKHLLSNGFLVSAADTAEKAIDTAWKEKPDLVIMDIKLPDMSGFELSGRLRAMMGIADIPVVYVGTRRDTGIRLATHFSGKEYLLNPIDLPALTKRIKEVVAKYRRRRIIEELLAKEDIPLEAEPTQDLTVEEQQKLRQAGAGLDVVDLGVEDPVLVGKMDFLNLLESSLSTAQVGKMLGVNESRIRQRLTSQPPSLYGIKRGPAWLMPSFQFEGKRLIPNIDRVIAKLDGNLHPLSVWRWFMSSNADLITEGSPEIGFSPREWLLRGLSVATVEELAENLHLS